MKKYILQTAFFLGAVCNLVAQNNMGSNIYSLTQYIPNSSAVRVNYGLKMPDNQYYYLMNCDVDPNYNYFNKSGMFTVNDSVIDFVSRYDSTNYFTQGPSYNMIDLNDSIILSAAGIMYETQEPVPMVPYYFFTFNTSTKEVIKKTYFIQQSWGNGSSHIAEFNGEILLFCQPAFLDTNGIREMPLSIYRYNYQLEELERKYYPRIYGDLQICQYTTFLKDGANIVVGGVLYNSNTYSEPNRVNRQRFFKLNENLEIVKEFIGEIDSSCGARCILKAPDGGYFAFSDKLNRLYYDTVDGYPSYSHLSQKASIYKFDENLNLQWKKDYLDDENHGSSFSDAIQTQDGNFVSAGSYFGYYSEECNCKDNLVWLQKVDDIGNVIWSRKYRVINGDRFSVAYVKQIIEEEDGNLRIIVSMELPFLDLPVWGFFANIFRTDANGCITEECSSVGLNEISNETEQVFTLFPNPTVESINVHFKEQIDQQYAICITDAQGKMVLSKICINDSYDSVINVNNYTPGVYYLHLIKDNKRMASKLFVKQ